MTIIGIDHGRQHVITYLLDMYRRRRLHLSRAVASMVIQMISIQNRMSVQVDGSRQSDCPRHHRHRQYKRTMIVAAIYIVVAHLHRLHRHLHPDPDLDLDQDPLTVSDLKT